VQARLRSITVPFVVAGLLVLLAPSPAAAADTCVFWQQGDYVHISKTSPEYAAQGHGWWLNGDCPATQADVTVQLEIYKSGTWYRVGTVGKKRVYQGGGSGNRATGHAGCWSTATYKWRSVIDVDLVGVVDSADKEVTPAVSVDCYR
jgi:hypothetical protein